MTAWQEQRGGLFAAVAARAGAWLLDPVEAPPRLTRVEREAPPPARGAAVAVVGLARGCGTSTVARALGVELARRHPGSAAAVSAASAPNAALATGPARRLARSLGVDARAVGRLALVHDDGGGAPRELAGSRRAPLVLDISHGTPPEAALTLCDRLVLVASPEVEPALAELAASALARSEQAPPLVVLNRMAEPGGWGGACVVAVPESRLAARLVLAGRDPLGALSGAVAALADACEEAAASA